MDNKQYEEKLKKCIKDYQVKAEHLSFTQSCHSVEEAAEVVHAFREDFVKSICMINSSGRLVVGIVKGEDRVSTTAVGKVLKSSRPRIATPDEMLRMTGYPCGGTPGFGYDAIFLVDTKVMEKGLVFLGGGSEQSLVKIDTKELLRVNNGQVVDIRK
ncbi:MAG TPA: YbaK/EbsC family protein [Candidatus Nanoarchaeia archaeon]|nr:YbaK/EbsC family protein [Candidatus Nanoarchaeia archaeon]